MPYLFTCPHCQTKTQVEDRYSGLAGECVTCGGKIEIPKFVAEVTENPPSTKPWKHLSSVVAAAVVLILLLCLAYAAIRQGSETVTRLQANRERTASMRNIERIAEALNAYALVHKSYPPPYTVDTSGRRMHSWRVLILPFLDQDDAYDSFNMDEPWDSAQNMQYAFSSMPNVYRHPSYQVNAGFNESAYYLVTGDGTLFPSKGPLGPDQVIDDPLKTILVLEASAPLTSGVWTEPIDIDFATVQGIGGTQNNVGGLLDDGMVVATIDERGHFIPDTLPLSTLKALITPRGGEPLADDTLD